MFKAQRRNDQKLYRCNAIGVIVQKRLPTLRRRSSAPEHVLCDGRLRDREAKFQKFAMDARRAPKRVFFTHAPYENAQFAIYLGTTARITGSSATKLETQPDASQ